MDNGLMENTKTQATTTNENTNPKLSSRGKNRAKKIPLCESTDPLKASKLMKKMVLVAALIIVVIGIVFYRSFAVIPFILGVIIMSGFNIFKIRLLERTTLKVLDMDNQESGKNTVRFQYLLRYFLTGVILLAIGFIHTYTSAPTPFSVNETHISVWTILFPGAPESLLNAPLISLWGALAGTFTMQISVMIVRSMKLEKDGTSFVKYEDNEADNNENYEHGNSDNIVVSHDDEWDGV